MYAVMCGGVSSAMWDGCQLSCGEGCQLQCGVGVSCHVKRGGGGGQL